MSVNVRERLSAIAKKDDAEGFGGAMKPAKSMAKPKRMTEYSKFVAEHRKGNKYSMKEIGELWSQHKNKAGGSKEVIKEVVKIKKVNGGAKKVAAKKVAEKKKPLKKKTLK